MNHNSIVNQNIKRRFVGREVIGCFTHEVKALFRAGYETGSGGYPKLEEVSNLYAYDIDGERLTEDEREEIIEELTDRMLNLTEKLEQLTGTTDETEVDPEDYSDPEELDTLIHNIETTQREIDCHEEAEQEPAEIYEWWAVSSNLAEKLQQQGECILEFGRNCYWGRQTTGQAILLDEVISRICEDMEILDGQGRSWAEAVK